MVSPQLFVSQAQSNGGHHWSGNTDVFSDFVIGEQTQTLPEPSTATRNGPAARLVDIKK